MTPAEAQAFIESHRELALATLDREGFPHLVAMNYGIDNGEIVMSSFAKAQKVVNLRRDPRVTVMIDSGKSYNTLKGVMIRGKAEITQGPQAVARVMRLIGLMGTGKSPAEAAAAADASKEEPGPQAYKRVIIRIKPTKWSSWDHSKLPAGTY